MRQDIYTYMYIYIYRYTYVTYCVCIYVYTNDTIYCNMQQLYIWVLASMAHVTFHRWRLPSGCKNPAKGFGGDLDAGHLRALNLLLAPGRRFSSTATSPCCSSSTSCIPCRVSLSRRLAIRVERLTVWVLRRMGGLSPSLDSSRSAPDFCKQRSCSQGVQGQDLGLFIWTLESGDDSVQKNSICIICVYIYRQRYVYIYIYILQSWTRWSMIFGRTITYSLYKPRSFYFRMVVYIYLHIFPLQDGRVNFICTHIFLLQDGRVDLFVHTYISHDIILYSTLLLSDLVHPNYSALL